MEVLLPPAQPHAAFGPKPAFGDRRFSSPNLLSNGEDLFCGYPSPSSPFGLAHALSTPSPRAASLSRGSSDSGSGSGSGSIVDGGEDAVATAERRQRLARLALQYQEIVTRFETCLSYLADASNEAAALRRENDELRVANEDLARRIKMVGGKLVDEFSGLRLAEEHIMPPPPSPLPAAPVLPKSISVRSPGYLKMNQNGKHRPSKPTKLGSVRSTPTPSSPMLRLSPVFDQSVHDSYLFVCCSQRGNPSSSACS